MRFDAPTWQGAYSDLALKGQAANADMEAGMALKYALFADQQRSRDAINALLRRKAEEEARKKAEREAERKRMLGMGVTIGGTVLGAGVGGIAAGAAAGGLSALGGGALGGAVGGTLGNTIGQGFGGPPSNMGSELMDFSTEFLPTNPNPFYLAAQQAQTGVTPGMNANGFGVIPGRGIYYGG